jgi:hypothetical protein
LAGLSRVDDRLSAAALLGLEERDVGRDQQLVGVEALVNPVEGSDPDADPRPGRLVGPDRGGQ